MEKLQDIYLNWFGEEESNPEPEDKTTVETTEEPKNEIDDKDLSSSELKQIIKDLNKKLSDKDKKNSELIHEVMKKKEKYRSLEQQIEDIEKQKEELHLKELEEKEEYKKLYEETKKKNELLVDDVSKTHKYYNDKYEEKIKNLPEEFHSLIPNTDVRDKINWIDNFNKTIKKREEEAAKELAKLQKKEPKKSEVPVGQGGVPNQDHNKQTPKNDISEQIKNASSYDELEKLLHAYGK